MSTIVGVEADGAVALAADRTNSTEGTVRGSVDRVFAFEDAAAAAVGSPGAVASFGRRLRADLDRDRVERDRPPALERVARMAADVAADEGVEAVVAARDDDGAPGLRAVDAGGAVLADDVAAFGSGAPVALGVLEEATFEGDADALEEQVRGVLATVADRDPETGDDVDSWSLGDD